MPSPERANLLQHAQLVIPASVDEATRKDVESNWERIRGICPECSTGATPGGPVVLGGNTPCPNDAPAPLFGTDDKVTIPRAEYEALLEVRRLHAASQTHPQ